MHLACVCARVCLCACAFVRVHTLWVLPLSRHALQPSDARTHKHTVVQQRIPSALPTLPPLTAPALLPTAMPSRLCNKTVPGEGRLLLCLQQQRAQIKQPTCRKQMLRLLGLAVEDTRYHHGVAQVCVHGQRGYCSGHLLLPQSDHCVCVCMQ